MRRLRDAALVAGFDLGESLRSWRVIALLVLYVGSAVASAGGFVAMLSELENTLAEQLRVSATDKPGALTEALMASEQLHQALSELTGDPSLVDSLVKIPLIALVYAWSALTFVPLLVTLTACEVIASDVSSGACRYSLVRTDRLTWALGRGLGQAVLLALGILCGALGAWVVGLLYLQGFAPADTAWWLLRLGGRAWVNGLPYLGLALGVSLVTKSTMSARALALVLLVAIGALDTFLASDWAREHGPTLVDTVRQVMPGAHTMALWRPDLLERLPSMVMQLALGCAYFGLGFAVFARRDA